MAGRIRDLALDVASSLVGSRFVSFLREMQSVQWLPEEALLGRSEARLAALLKHAAANVPFYRNAYQSLGLAPHELCTITDLAWLPVVSKAIYREQGLERFFAENLPHHLRLERTTSGSTGQPFQFCIDRRVQPVIFASHLFYDSWFDLRPFDKYVRIVAPPAAASPLPGSTPTLFRLRQAVTRRLQDLYEGWTQRKIWLWEVDSESAESIWRDIESFRPSFVMGYTSTLATIADELRRRDLRLTRPLRGVITIAETLSPTRKRLIDEYFRAPIINRYGLREFGYWSAQNCHHSPDHFHINTELTVCEVLRDDGSPAAPGETGRVVLTDLSNYVMPFIRYETGDLAVACSGVCGCGRGFPLLGQIEGRSHECVMTPAGRVISPVILGHYLFVYHDHLKFVSHYQLIQESPASSRLLIVPRNGWDEHRRERIREDLARLLGDEIEVAVEAVREIPPEKSGKRPIIKSVSTTNCKAGETSS